MPDKYTYLLIDLLCILFPFAFSFYPKISFYKQWRNFIIPCVLTGTFFIVWDALYTARGIWGFNPRYVCGVWLLGLPLEEYLFFLCIPYACVFTYYSLNLFFKFRNYNDYAIFLSWMLMTILMTTAISRLHQLYTSVTFVLLALLLLLLALKKAKFLAGFYVSFLIILVPFFISNGLLTGTGLAEPVVHYDDRYNLGLRMWTIPVEDTFYGMLLLLMNVAGFEFLRDPDGVI